MFTLHPSQTTPVPTMASSNPNPARVRRQYVVRSLLFMSVYVAINQAAIFGTFDNNASPLGALALALIVSAPVAGHIWAVLAYMRDSDEFMRAWMAKRFIVASGISMALSCTWGFMESYAHAWHAPGYFNYVLFCMAYGPTRLFIRTSH
jgi:putative oxidoreductase